MDHVPGGRETEKTLKMITFTIIQDHLTSSVIFATSCSSCQVRFAYFQNIHLYGTIEMKIQVPLSAILLAVAYHMSRKGCHSRALRKIKYCEVGSRARLFRGSEKVSTQVEYNLLKISIVLVVLLGLNYFAVVGYLPITALSPTEATSTTSGCAPRPSLVARRPPGCAEDCRRSSYSGHRRRFHSQ